jgi:ribosome biogenesis protein BMS1
MRTHGEVRAEQNLPVPAKRDSTYRTIEREPRRFNPLKIPKTLQAALPFKSKPKMMAKQKGKSLETRRAVVVDPAEKKVGSFMQQLKTLRNAKEDKAKARAQAKSAERNARLAKETAAREKATKEHRKRRYRREGIEVEIKAKIAKSAKGGGRG